MKEAVRITVYIEEWENESQLGMQAPVVNYRAAQASGEEQQKSAYKWILIQNFDAQAYSTVIHEYHDNHEEKWIIGISMRG
jgi:hypothetical protein